MTAAETQLSARFRATSDLGLLWYTLARKEWTTLAVACPEDTDSAARLAGALVQLAGSHHGVLDVRDVSEFLQKLGTARRQEAEEHGGSTRPWRYLLPLNSVLDLPQASELIAACDGVVLLLEKGRTRFSDAATCVGMIGPERLLGAVLGTP